MNDHINITTMQSQWAREIEKIANAPVTDEEKIEAVKMLSLRIKNYLKEVGQEAMINELTGFVEQPFLGQFLDKRYMEAEHFGHDIAILVLGVRHFEVFWNSFGDLEAVKAILGVSKIIEDSIRDNDIVCRFGLDKFVVILPETNPNQASRLANMIKQQAENNLFAGNQKIEIIFAIASRSQGFDSSDRLFEQAMSQINNY
jgi:diguanylate cyclase